MKNFQIRFAKEDDSGIILRLIQGLAQYEKLSHQVTATQEGIRETLFVKRQAEVIIAQEDGKAVGFALFFPNYSTFLGKAGIYLEDLFVLEEYRGRGYGKALFERLAQIAEERGCERMDWWCLDWNKSSIDFYKSMAAVPMDEWTVWRLEKAAIKRLADKQPCRDYKL